MSEELIIEHAAPTLAGIKTGSLFSVSGESEDKLTRELRKLNGLLRSKGLRVIPLKKTARFVLIYIYRPDRLKRDLEQPGALHILKKRGYRDNCNCPERCIVQLVKYLGRDEGFPHEIGLFLGYPPSDVECFMRDPHKGVKCCGCWKAYSEPEKAVKIFRKYKQCTEIYREMNKKRENTGTACRIYRRHGKKIALFGSYGWGDGQWMREWEERCINDGAKLASDSVMANNAPGDDALEECKSLGRALA